MAEKNGSKSWHDKAIIPWSITPRNKLRNEKRNSGKFLEGLRTKMIAVNFKERRQDGEK